MNLVLAIGLAAFARLVLADDFPDCVNGPVSRL
jgi:hypothetical protein